MKIPTIALCACLAVASGAAACRGEQGLARSETPRAFPVAGAMAEMPRLAAGLDRFALGAYREIRAGDDGNIFYSPLSVALALAMAAAGAEGDTRAQMYRVMHVELPADEMNPAFNALELAIAGDGGDDRFKLHFANGLWAQRGFALRPGFLDVLARYYGAGLGLVDFKDDAQRKQARRAINTWVGDETNGKIEDLIPEGMLTPDTRLVLGNAVYFLGKWVDPFDADSKDQAFTRNDGSTVQVAMMSRTSGARYADGNGCQAVSLEYLGDRIEMVVLLPAPDTFDAFDAAIDAERLDTIMDSLQSVRLHLYLPRFTYEATLDFVPVLKALGMVAAFESHRADFSGITMEEKLSIAAVVHKAFVAVDEEGTEAAAATALGFLGTSLRPQKPHLMRVDRPFLFVIRDRRTGTILFMGRVMDPS